MSNRDLNQYLDAAAERGVRADRREQRFEALAGAVRVVLLGIVLAACVALGAVVISALLWLAALIITSLPSA